MDKNDIILRISKLRQRNNLSARALSLKIGKHDTYINRMEQRGFEPTFDTICDIVNVCGSSIEEFFYEDFDNYKTDKELITLIHKLPPEKRKTLIQFLD